MPRQNEIELLTLLMEGEDDLEEDEMLWLAGGMRNFNPQQHRGKFDFSKLTDVDVRTNFRFERKDLEKLPGLLQMPDYIICANRTKSSSLEALCIFLRRLSYPNRFYDLTFMFRRSEAELSFICKEVLQFIYNRHGHLLHNLNRRWLRKHDLEKYAAAISNKGAPLMNCWGFIDGTIRPTCRPTKNQRLVYSGHKRVHGLKFQSVVTPDGLVANLFGPVEGRRHDSHMLRASNILIDLEDLCGNDFCLYGDPGYPMRNSLIVPFKGAQLTPEEELFNAKMSAVRESVEWGFSKIIQNFSFLDFKKNLKIYLQPVGKLYLVGALLTNLHTCFYGSTTSAYFEVEPPSPEHYLEIDE